MSAPPEIQVDVAPLDPPPCDTCDESEQMPAEHEVTLTVWLGGLGHAVGWKMCRLCLEEYRPMLEALGE